MGNNYRMVSIDELRPGNFIGDVFNEAGKLLYSADTVIEGYHQIESLRRQGVAAVFIPYSQNVSDSKQEVIPPELSVDQYYQNIDSVYEIKKKSIEIIRNFIDSAKTGNCSTIASLQSDLEAILIEVIEKVDFFIAIKSLHQDEQLYNHSLNVAILMAGLAKLVGYSQENVIEVAISGILHDIGKIRLPSELLYKETMLTRLESEVFRKHPKMGVELIRRLHRDVPKLTVTVIAQHHERINGSGYPDKLKGGQIDDFSILCSLADIYDSLTTEGRIKKALLPQEALALIFQGADEEYPREIVEYFTKFLGIYPVGSFVKLESGEMGIVIRINHQRLLLPHVMLFFDIHGERMKRPLLRDLSNYHPKGNENSLLKITGTLNPEHFNFKLSELTSNKKE